MKKLMATLLLCSALFSSLLLTSCDETSDAANYLSQITESTASGVIDMMIFYNRDLTTACTKVYADDKYYSQTLYRYDKNGKRCATEESNIDGYSKITEWTNDKNGKPQSGSYTMVDEDGKTTKATLTYAYDDKGRETFYKEVNDSSEVLFSRTTEYLDEYGSYKITVKRAAEDSYTMEFYYNEAGEQTKIAVNSNFNFAKHSYDKRGRRVRTDWTDTSGNSAGYETFTYDKYGNIYRDSRFNSKGQPTSDVYNIYSESIRYYEENNAA